MTNAEWMIKNGYKFKDLGCYVTSCNGDYIIRLNGNYVESVTSYSCSIGIEKWLEAEHKDLEEL